LARQIGANDGSITVLLTISIDVAMSMLCHFRTKEKRPVAGVRSHGRWATGCLAIVLFVMLVGCRRNAANAPPPTAVTADPAVPGDGSAADATGPAAPADAGGYDPAAAQRELDAIGVPRPGAGFLGKLIAWLGRFHPPAVNFPIALLVAGAIAVGLRTISNPREFDFTARFCAWLAGLAAPFAALLGWYFAGFRFVDASWLLLTHRWLGTLTAVWAVLVVVLCELSSRRETRLSRRLFYAALLVAAGLVLLTGYVGGAMAWGQNHFAWPRALEAPPSLATAAEKVPAAKQPAAGVPKPGATVTMSRVLTFEPSTVTIRVGQTVRWKNTTGVAQTVTADPSQAKTQTAVALPPDAEPFDSGNIEPGATFSHTFVVPGRYRYFSVPYESMEMVGNVEVTAENR
jgi:plastocyanin